MTFSQIKEIVTNKKLKNEEIAKQIDKSETYIRAFRKFLELLKKHNLKEIEEIAKDTGYKSQLISIIKLYKEEREEKKLQKALSLGAFFRRKYLIEKEKNLANMTQAHEATLELNRKINEIEELKEELKLKNKEIFLLKLTIVIQLIFIILIGGLR